MENKILFFENSRGEQREIVKVTSIKEAYAAMRKFCKERDFKIYYIQFDVTPTCATEVSTPAWDLRFDVGSWSEFFHIYFFSEEEAQQFVNKVD